MVVHQEYLSREVALLSRPDPCDEAEQDRARRAVVRLAARLAPDEPGAGGEVLEALGLTPPPAGFRRPAVPARGRRPAATTG